MSELPDALARNEALPKNAPASDANRTKAGHEQWLVVVSLCTHLGCRLSPVRRETSASLEGWFCPCHAARFDLSGRVRSGPARTNLPVPPYAFLTPMKIRIGRPGTNMGYDHEIQ
jgi:ubiquinol-cytochrome c reductase iron-sulfur subunit